MMTDYKQLVMTRQDRHLEAAQKELSNFERQELEFRKKDRRERAAEIGLPLEKIESH
jgi:hypothetical protein